MPASTRKTGPQYLNVFDNATYDATSGICGSGPATNIPLGNYLVSAPNYLNFDVLTTSGDWTISNKDSFRGRYIYNKWTGIDTLRHCPRFTYPLPERYHLIALSEYPRLHAQPHQRSAPRV